MIWGMSTETFTELHVLISLVGIATGLVVLYGLLVGKRLKGWTAVFLITTIATSVTGFGFPIKQIGPPHIIGVISLVLLTIAVIALYLFNRSSAWRRIYVVTAIISLYLNVFVLIVQAYLKIPALKALAPTQTEPAFVITQLVFLTLFLALTIAAAVRFPKPSLARV